MRWLWVVLILLWPLAGVAQGIGPSPILRSEIDATEAVPGQFVTLRLTVLVPSFMKSPPEWPDLAMPDLLIRLPDRSSSPVSEQIDGQAWAGISRRYLIAPMGPGVFDLPPIAVHLGWPDPDTGEDLETTLTAEPLRLRGVVPEGAEALDPFIAANDLTLEQTIEGTPEAMAPGDSLTRTLTVTVAGVSPIMVPTLGTFPDSPSLTAYPAEPVVEETSDRGALGGRRTEAASFVAAGGGTLDLPGVTLDWYNLDTGQVETAQVEPVAIKISGPAPISSVPRDPVQILKWVALAVAALILLGTGWRWGWPAMRIAMARRRAAHLASEAWAFGQLGAAVKDRDYRRLRPALDLWIGRCPGLAPGNLVAFEAALIDLGVARFGPNPGTEDAAWTALAKALTNMRHAPKRGQSTPALPALNLAQVPSDL